MQLNFTKYQGTGNDFILIDNRGNYFPDDPSLIQVLCDRHFGIGADGLMLIESDPVADYRMIFYNPDGSESLCGNGSRCSYAFARALGMVGERARLRTTDGLHDICMVDDQVGFQMSDVSRIDWLDPDYFVFNGSPHLVRFVDDVDKVNVQLTGASLRHDVRFSDHQGTNVNFVQFLKNGIGVRTYERGVEAETLSCGTGVTAAVLAAALFRDLPSPVSVHARGGVLKVSFKRMNEGFTDIWLTGPARHVFDGVWTIGTNE